MRMNMSLVSCIRPGRSFLQSARCLEMRNDIYDFYAGRYQICHESRIFRCIIENLRMIQKKKIPNIIRSWQLILAQMLEIKLDHRSGRPGHQPYRVQDIYRCRWPEASVTKSGKSMKILKYSSCALPCCHRPFRCGFDGQLMPKFGKYDKRIAGFAHEAAKYDRIVK